MKLVEWMKRIMVGFGAEWVMWLLIALSVVSVAIILERAWFFHSLRDDLIKLKNDLQKALSSGELEETIPKATERMRRSRSAEAAVVMAGLEMAHRGAQAAEEAMAGAAAIQRMKLEKRLAYLGTLGNNAPFIGLFGTVIGVVMAFDALGAAEKQSAAEAAQSQIASQAVMSSIAEALVATAIGLAVAIPAVAANNTFLRLTKTTLGNTEALTRVLLAHLKSTPLAMATAGGGAVEKRTKRASAPSKSRKKDEGDDDEDDDEEQD